MELNEFFNITGVMKLTKNIITAVKYYVNELFIARTACHLIKRKYQVTGHYLCTKYIVGCQEFYFW